MPPVTPRPISMGVLVGGGRGIEVRDVLDLPRLDFLHRRPRRLELGIHFRRAALEQLLGPRTRDDDVLELVHTDSFPANELVICATTGIIAARRARSASTIARRRSTQAFSSSFTTT